MDVLFYVNQIYQDEIAGQNSFEVGVMDALDRRVAADADQDVMFFTARRPDAEANANAKNTIQLPLSKSSYGSYLAHQWRLFWALRKEAKRQGRKDISLYVRYNAAMIAPLLAACLFRWRLVFRTGPVLPNLIQYGKTNSWLVLGVIKQLLGLHCRVADKIIVATRRIGQWVAETYPFAEDKLMVISNGVDPTRFMPQPRCRSQWGLPEDAFVFGFTGTCAELQGISTVLLALRKLKETGARLPYLLIVGDGPDKPRWEQMSRDLGLDRYVVFSGRRPREEISSAIGNCDVMLLPLHLSTLNVRGTSAIKLFEYLACDRFVLGSQCEDLDFLPQQGVGELVEPENIAAWAEAIHETMNSSRHILSGKARKLALQEFTFDAVADRIWSACFDDGPAAAKSTLSTRRTAA
jgi:glycosyltransferase involved in cell wall biosynthesis